MIAAAQIGPLVCSPANPVKGGLARLELPPVRPFTVTGQRVVRTDCVLDRRELEQLRDWIDEVLR